jgi:hypothetical protein
MIKKGAKFHHIDEIMHIYNDIREHDKEFSLKQIEETENVKKELFMWAGLEFNDYKDNWNNLKGLVCKVLDDLLVKKDEDLKFRRGLLEKNKRLICNISL